MIQNNVSPVSQHYIVGWHHAGYRSFRMLPPDRPPIMRPMGRTPSPKTTLSSTTWANKICLAPSHYCLPVSSNDDGGTILRSGFHRGRWIIGSLAFQALA